MIRRLSLTGAIAVLLLGSVAGASEQVVRQKGRRFSVDVVVVPVNGTVVFQNDDSVPHNLTSVSPGNEFDLGSQAPGTESLISFDQAGSVAVICAIHPHMKMTITVAR